MSSHVDAMKPWLQNNDHPGHVANRASSPYQVLRESLRSARIHDSDNCLTFTGIRGSEGANYVAWGYAESLGQDSRVLFIDAGDGVESTVAKSSQPSPLDLAPMILRSREPKMLDGSGVQVAALFSPLPSESFASTSFGAWLSRQSDRYDSVILHASSLLGNSSTTAMAKHSDGVVLVVKAHTTPAAELAQLRQYLDQQKCPCLGAVLNGAERIPRSIGRFLTPSSPLVSRHENVAIGDR